MSAAGRLAYFAGIGGFLVDFDFAAIAFGSTNPLLDVVGAQLGADAVERIRLLAFAGNGVAGAALLGGVDLLALLRRPAPRPGKPTNPTLARQDGRLQDCSRRDTSSPWDLQSLPRCRSPQVSSAEDERVRGIGPIDVPEHQRTGLDDAVDDGLVEGKVVDPEWFVEVRQRRRPVVRDPVPDVDVQLLQLVVDVGQLIGGRQRSAGNDAVAGSCPARSCSRTRIAPRCSRRSSEASA